VEQVSKGIMKSGRAATESEAIHMALGVLARWARGGGKVSPEVQAAAAKAIAEFAALRAKAAAHSHANEDGAAMSLSWNGVEGIELGAPAVAERVPPGRREGGQFAGKATVLGRYDTPERAALVINGMDAAERAVARASTLPPPGFAWTDADRLAVAE
jgi:hypothetical protein